MLRGRLSDGDVALLAWKGTTTVVLVADAIPLPFVDTVARHALSHANDWRDGAEIVTVCSIRTCSEAARWLPMPGALTDGAAS